MKIALLAIAATLNLIVPESALAIPPAPLTRTVGSGLPPVSKPEEIVAFKLASYPKASTASTRFAPPIPRPEVDN